MIDDDEYPDDSAAGWSSVWLSTSEAPAIAEWSVKSMVWMSQCGSTVAKKMGSNFHAATLAQPILMEGVYHLTYSLRGDCVVGVADAAVSDDAEDAQWKSRAWGFGSETGCLHYATATADGMPGIEIGPQRMEGDTAEHVVHMELDMDASSLRIRHHADDTWQHMPVTLPSAVRPWALLSASSARDVAPEVRLVSCVAHERPWWR